MANKEIARIEIICSSNEEIAVKIDGERQSLIAGLASLLADDDENNEFNKLLQVATHVILFNDKLEKAAAKKKAAKKKAAPVKKKSVVKKAAVVKKKK